MPEDWARPVVVFEIRGRDNKRTQDFYRQMFNWDIQVDGNGIGRAEGGIGAPEPGPLSIYLQSDTPGVTPYIQVLDLHASMEKAKALGGSVINEPFDVPNGPTIARIADPDGTHIGLVQQ
jgi:predicted enzyme related to lactoylglutathione lyase